MSKSKIRIKSNAELAAERKANPPISRDKDRVGFRATEHGTLGRLMVGMTVLYRNEPHIVELVNECRARIRPVNVRRTKVSLTDSKTGKVREFEPEFSGGSISISPNSEIRILSR